MTPRANRPGITYLLGLCTGLVLMGTFLLVFPRESSEDLAFYRHVRDLVQHEFVREVDERELLDGALTGMLESLDDYSRYYVHEDVQRVDRETRGEFRGVGVVFRRPTSDGQVLFPLDDSPAQRANLRVGDRLIEVNDQLVESMGDGGLQQALREPREDGLELMIEALDGERRELLLMPEAVVDPTLRHVSMLDTELGLGYVSIHSFSRRTAAEFDEAVAWLRARGMRGMVLDLRGNPGGVLDAALAIANRFVPEGVLLTTASRDGQESTEADPERCSLEGLPLVLLVDEDSASASEVLAGALQDHRAGVLVGAPTYGKGAVQTLARYDSQRAIVKLTTSYYTTPAGRVIDRGLAEDGAAGLTPDLVVELDRAQRAAVLAYLAEYGPPPSALEALHAWELELGQELYARAPEDAQLEAARALLDGTLATTAP